MPSPSALLVGPMASSEAAHPTTAIQRQPSDPAARMTALAIPPRDLLPSDSPIVHCIFEAMELERSEADLDLLAALHMPRHRTSRPPSGRPPHNHNQPHKMAHRHERLVAQQARKATSTAQIASSSSSRTLLLALCRGRNLDCGGKASRPHIEGGILRSNGLGALAPMAETPQVERKRNTLADCSVRSGLTPPMYPFSV